MQRARNGDAAAFSELVTHHSTSALRVATVVLGTAEGARDAVQTASLRAWRARNRIDPERGFRAWYLRIVANAARNDRRSRSRHAALVIRTASIAPTDVVTPEVAAVTAAERDLVLRGLNLLQPDDRLVLALRFFEELTQEEIALVLGCPIGTVKSRLSRATSRLRQILSTSSEER